MSAAAARPRPSATPRSLAPARSRSSFALVPGLPLPDLKDAGVALAGAQCGGGGEDRGDVEENWLSGLDQPIDRPRHLPRAEQLGRVGSVRAGGKHTETLDARLGGWRSRACRSAKLGRQTARFVESEDAVERRAAKARFHQQHLPAVDRECDGEVGDERRLRQAAGPGAGDEEGLRRRGRPDRLHRQAKEVVGFRFRRAGALGDEQVRLVARPGHPPSDRKPAGRGILALACSAPPSPVLGCKSWRASCAVQCRS